jgi:hypothetical protein
MSETRHSRALQTSAPPPIDPTPPQNFEQLGIPQYVVTDIVLRYLREHGTTSLTTMRRALKLSFSVIDAVFQQFRQQQFLEIRGTIGNDYQFSLTNAARQIASERSQVCRYAGPVPVSLEHYTRVVRSQRVAIAPTPDALQEAFADLVLPEDLLDRVGPALISRRPLFIYGPTGNGKTSLVERFPRIFEDFILVPYAVEVDGHLITVYDPLLHRTVGPEPDEMIDQRWVRCRRPFVIAAGELTMAMLDLRYEERSGVYGAPLQMKAANGVLLIDDFGRQAMSPRELFNRWIYPLDRRVDFLSLQHGHSFQIPFEVLLAFATNLSPNDLVDDAFLRRVPNKIYLGPVSSEVFDEIFRRVLQKHGLPFETELAAHLRALCMQHANELRACHPHDICEILVALASYKRQPFHISRQSLNFAAETYFTQSALT